jgi:hypothetical protein
MRSAAISASVIVGKWYRRLASPSWRWHRPRGDCPCRAPSETGVDDGQQIVGSLDGAGATGFHFGLKGLGRRPPLFQEPLNAGSSPHHPGGARMRVPRA